MTEVGEKLSELWATADGATEREVYEWPDWLIELSGWTPEEVAAIPKLERRITWEDVVAASRVGETNQQEK